MADNNTFFGRGIPLASGFDLGAKAPLDSRLVVNDIAERDAHVTGNRAYTGLVVYVISEQKNYQFNGTEWVEFGGAKAEDLHEHANKDLLDSLTTDMVAKWNAKSEFSGDYNDLENKPEIPSIEGLATEDFVLGKIAEIPKVDLTPYALKEELFSGDYNDLENKPVIPSIAGLASEDYVKNAIAEAQLNAGDQEVDLSGLATKDELNALLGDISVLQGQSHVHANADVLEGLTAAKIAEWDAKPTKQYVDEELDKKLNIDDAIYCEDIYGDVDYDDIPN